MLDEDVCLMKMFFFFDEDDYLKRTRVGCLEEIGKGNLTKKIYGMGVSCFSFLFSLLFFFVIFLCWFLSFSYVYLFSIASNVFYFYSFDC